MRLLRANTHTSYTTTTKSLEFIAWNGRLMWKCHFWIYIKDKTMTGDFHTTHQDENKRKKTPKKIYKTESSYNRKNLYTRSPLQNNVYFTTCTCRNNNNNKTMPSDFLFVFSFLFLNFHSKCTTHQSRFKIK